VTAVFAVATGIVLLGLLEVERVHHPRRGWVKAAASAGFIGTALAAGAADTVYGRWVLAALLLGWVGDVALVSSARSWFLTGLVAFLLSHLTYVVAFVVLGLDGAGTAIAAAGVAVPAAVVGRWLWDRVPKEMRGPVLAYIVVISAMVAAAAGAAVGGAPELLVAAAVLFYVSDLFVARDRFVAAGFVNRLAGLPMYYGAQILFAVSTGLV
jgi:uncharacterized membrane protein YhhN